LEVEETDNLSLFFKLFILFEYSEGPTKINFDILVSSFGPIQDMDMVCILTKIKIFICYINKNLVIYNELLFSSTMA
jgi:hypothetical protein